MSEDSPKSVAEYIHLARESGHDAFGLANDPEAEAVWAQIHDSGSMMNEETNKLREENAKLRERQTELLQLIVKLTREVPYEGELDECRRGRAALIAKVGTLEARVLELELLLQERS